MESINLIKGYGKITPLPEQDQTSLHHNHKLTAPIRRNTALISLLLLLASLLLATTLASLIYHFTTNKHHDSTTPTPTNSTDSIRFICSVTHYSNSCISSLSSLNNLPPKPDPVLILILSLNISVTELNNISTLPQILTSNSNDPYTVSALRECVTLFGDAVSELKDAISVIREGLTGDKIRQTNTLISAAMTYKETCLDGLEEMKSPVLDEVRMKVQRSHEYMSNSLAILVNINTLLNKFGLPIMH